MLGPVRQRKSAALFKLFDYDGDGFWEREDFDTFVGRLADARGLAPDAPEVRSLAEVYLQVWYALAAADADGDGRSPSTRPSPTRKRTSPPRQWFGSPRSPFPCSTPTAKESSGRTSTAST